MCVEAPRVNKKNSSTRGNSLPFSFQKISWQQLSQPHYNEHKKKFIKILEKLCKIKGKRNRTHKKKSKKKTTEKLVQICKRFDEMNENTFIHTEKKNNKIYISNIQATRTEKIFLAMARLYPLRIKTRQQLTSHYVLRVPSTLRGWLNSSQADVEFCRVAFGDWRRVVYLCYPSDGIWYLSIARFLPPPTKTP